MSADEQRKLAAIMFTDMVGYSALSQRDEKLAQELLEEHRRLLREVFPRFNGTEIKTIGDAFLVEFGSALEAAQCAIEIQRTLAHRDADAPADRQIQVRIGIHIGDVVHRGGDVYGDGVNIASRIEPVAGPGGICVSMDVERQVRSALEARFEKLAPTDLKNISVPMDLFRIVLPWETKPAPSKSEIRLRQSGSDKSETGARSRRIFATSFAIILLLAGLLGYQLWRTRNQAAPSKQSGVGEVPVKSIAVLPFENLSEEKANAFFADGVQDQILTDLSQIADLKVISRTSVMQYKSGFARNLREISQQLGVAHVVEGSVQRAANKVRVNAQLIDARNDTHLWAQTYDRDLADVFAIQSEIAKAIAEQLQAKLSPAEKSAIEQRPTSDLTAFDQYTRARTLLLTTSLNISGDKSLLQAIELLDSAVARDGSFHAAFCQLVNAHDQLYAVYADHTPERLAAAEAALQRATELRPEAAETHLVRGSHLYFAFRNYKQALSELQTAGAGLPNDPRIPELTGYILRRQGKPQEGLHALEKAVALDPRNASIISQLALSYQNLRRYAEEKVTLERALEITPDDVGLAGNLAAVDLLWHADTASIHQFIDRVRAERLSVLGDAANFWFIGALADRDWMAAEQALTALGNTPFWADNVITLSRQFGQGLLARAMHDKDRASKSFAAARLEQEQVVQKQADYGPALCVLGLIDAALGNTEVALQEGRRAMELLPVERDSLNGQMLMAYFAIIAAWSGEKDLALQQLATAVPTQGAALITSYGFLKLSPFWDPLRGDPRFEQIVASLAPKEADK